jgi:hypothetical protein
MGHDFSWSYDVGIYCTRVSRVTFTYCSQYHMICCTSTAMCQVVKSTKGYQLSQCVMIQQHC